VLTRWAFVNPRPHSGPTRYVGAWHGRPGGAAKYVRGASVDDVAYCCNGCGQPAVGERILSVGVDPDDGDLLELVELLCIDCLDAH
jgi:hypothetical protein